MEKDTLILSGINANKWAKRFAKELDTKPVFAIDLFEKTSMEEAFAKLKKLIQGKVFENVIGHSLGGALVLKALQETIIEVQNAVILIAPVIHAESPTLFGEKVIKKFSGEYRTFCQDLSLPENAKIFYAKKDKIVHQPQVKTKNFIRILSGSPRNHFSKIEKEDELIKAVKNIL